jgi:hypothetical protein
MGLGSDSAAGDRESGGADESAEQGLTTIHAGNSEVRGPPMFRALQVDGKRRDNSGLRPMLGRLQH